MISSDRISEKCGIVGVFTDSNDSARVAYYSLWALQHRGQESSGIVSATKTKLHIHKGQGLVANVYNEKSLSQLKGGIAIGHNRYSTSGGISEHHAQPVCYADNTIALAHNGNIPIIQPLKKILDDAGMSTYKLNDSELLHKAIRYNYLKLKSFEAGITKTLSNIPGVYSLVMLTKNQLAAARDPFGIRPLSLGKLADGWIIASETCVFDTIGAKFIRDINPGELLIIDKSGLRSIQFHPNPSQKIDIFEFVYFSRPDSMLLGKSVYEARKQMGYQLAIENPDIKADLVIPIPDSAIPATIGFSHESKIPFEMGIVKNRYIHRTFIKPAAKQRGNDVQMKLNPITEIIRNKHIVIVDDSIVRGTTSKKIVNLLRSYGARKITMIVSSPPVTYPDFYGIDTPEQKELIAFKRSIKEICNIIQADDLRFLSYEGLLKAIDLPENLLCTSCFTGEYPVKVAKNVIDVIDKSKNISNSNGYQYKLI